MSHHLTALPPPPRKFNFLWGPKKAGKPSHTGTHHGSENPIPGHLLFFFFFLINSRNLFITVLEARNLRSECQHSQVLVRAHRLWTAKFSLCSHVVEEGKRAFLGFFHKGTNPVHDHHITC